MERAVYLYAGIYIFLLAPLIIVIVRSQAVQQHNGEEQLDGDNDGTEFAVWHFTGRCHPVNNTNQIHSLNFPLNSALQSGFVVSIRKI
jgi:hypothetical protein